MLTLPEGIVINVGSDEYTGVIAHCHTCGEWNWTWHPKPSDEELLATVEAHVETHA